MKSGEELIIRGNILYVLRNGKVYPVVCFSKKFKDEIAKMLEQGYCPTKAKIRFIVAWKGKEDTEDTAVILPEIYFGRR